MWEKEKHQYEIVSRFLITGEGWKVERELVLCDYVHAGFQASLKARELDRRFGDDHFWTVDLKEPKDSDSSAAGCSYFQLFHGRLA